MASFSTLTEQVETGARMLVPYALMALLFFLNVAAAPYPLNTLIKAPLFFAGIYYWAIFRPTLIPVWLVFLSGCLMDILSGLPVGLNALVLVGVYWIVTDQRRFLLGQPFVMTWIVFSLLVLVAGLTQWALFGLVTFHWSSPHSLWISSFLGVAIFPLICLVLHLAHKMLPAPRTAIRFNSQS